MLSTVDGFTFAVLALATLGGAVAMLSTKNIVHAAFWLLEVSVAAACLYFLLGADYVALVQLMVYAGAVAVLLIFAIMITLRRREDAIRPRDFSLLGAILGLLFFALMAFVLVRAHFPVARMPRIRPDLFVFGKIMFTSTGWALPFEIASVVLTAALVGAIWWAKDGDQ